MSMKKWTTWQLAPESDEQERLIVTTEDGETEITGIIPDEADARLIAAAPDLLDACIQLRDFFTREMDQGCALSLEEENAYNAANAAIAKALGDA